MKTRIVLNIVGILLVVTCTLNADLIFDSGYNTYIDDDGYNFEVWVTNNAILDVLGGEIGKLETTDTATTNIYNTEIDWLWTGNNSIANVYGNNINWLAAYENSLVNIYAYDVVYHPTGGGEYGNKEWLEGTYYVDNSPFSLWLYNDGAYQHINIIPEPATFILFGLGGLFLKKRRYCN